MIDLRSAWFHLVTSGKYFIFMNLNHVKYLFFVLVLCLSTQMEAKRATNLRMRGEQKFQEGRYAEALDLFAQYEQEDDVIFDELYLHRKAESYYKLGKFDHALISYELVLETNPEMVNYTFLKGLIQRSSLVYYYSELLEEIDAIQQTDVVAYTFNDTFQIFSVVPFHALNTEYSEFGAVEFQGRIYLSSITDRRFGKKNVNTNLSHYDIYSVDEHEAHRLVDFGDESYEDLSDLERHSLEVAKGRFKFQFEDKINTSYNNGPISFLGDDIAYVTINQENKSGRESVYNLTLNKIVLSEDPSKVFDEMGQDYFGQYFSPADVGQITFSQDLQKACMAVKLKDSPTKSDLWFANRLSNGKWGEPYLAGDKINTSSDDLFPYWSHDDYLYYSTDGLQANGGLDVYRVDMLNPDAEPQNVGLGINSNFDDFAFSVNRDGQGYLTSNRSGGRGDDDIYIVKQRKGHIKVVYTGRPETAKNPSLEVSDSRNGSNIASVNVLKTPIYVTKELPYGEYDLTHILPVDSTYKHISLYQDTLTVNVNFSNAKSDTLPVTFTNFCFSCDKMDAENARRFKYVVAFLKKFPEIQLSLTGNTDIFGTDEHNEALGMRRADLMEKWLREAGVTNKIYKSSNGKRKTISDIDHKLNRRVDIELYWPGNKNRIEFISGEDSRLDNDLYIEYDFAFKYSKRLTSGYYVFLKSFSFYVPEAAIGKKYGIDGDKDIMLYSEDPESFDYYYKETFQSAVQANIKMRKLGVTGSVVYLENKRK